MTQNNYVLRGGEKGADRLRLLAEVKWPPTKSLLQRVGLRQGMHCLDIGCGIGAVALEIAASVGPSGRVVGMDIDERCLELARFDADARGLAIELGSGSGMTFRRFLLTRGNKAMLKRLFTIGHSNHPLDRFLALLAQHQIVALADIRRFPGSRKHPHFNQEKLGTALRNSGVEYYWFEALGGRRRKEQGESANVGLRNEGFRNYADYMHTDEFQKGVTELLKVARKKRTALMCAEGLFWQCHRRLVSDFLLANGLTVQHIMPNGKLHRHTITEGGKMVDGGMAYPG